MAAPARPISTSTGSGAARSMAPISSGVTIGTSPPASTPANGGPWLVPARSSVLGRATGGAGARATTMAWAAVSLWVRVSAHSATPASAASSAARPVSRSDGTPSSSRSTSISCHDAAPMPTPERLQHGLLDGEAHRVALDRVAPALGVLPLSGGEEPLDHPRPAGEDLPEPVEVDQVGADPDDAAGHERQRSARSFTGSVMRSTTGTSTSRSSRNTGSVSVTACLRAP